jgi:hyperosmotically inducible periplasmic protein
MYTQQLRKLVLVTAVVLPLAAVAGNAGAKTVSQDVTDARQESQIWTTYALSPYLRANDLKVSVRNGKATMTGKVDDGVNKDLATQIALGVNGVNEVDSRILVEAGYAPPAQSSSRSYGEMIDDATINAAVKSKLIWGKHTDGLAMNVDTKSGKVSLQGTADSAAARDLAGRLAMNTRGVVSVNNQLVVNGTKATVENSAGNPADEAGHGMGDGWITIKVKSTFMYSGNVNSSDISVSTKGGIVTLSGRVDSGVEQALAIELAQNIRGVKSVQSKDLTF